MATTIIRVYNTRYNEWAENVRVALGWDGIVNLGMSRDVYTGSDGRAIIDHSATGEASLYVNGSNVGTIDTPGSTTIEI